MLSIIVVVITIVICISQLGRPTIKASGKALLWKWCLNNKRREKLFIQNEEGKPRGNALKKWKKQNKKPPKQTLSSWYVWSKEEISSELEPEVEVKARTRTVLQTTFKDFVSYSEINGQLWKVLSDNAGK